MCAYELLLVDRLIRELARDVSPVAEARLLGQDSEESGRSTPGFVQAGLPLADSLLPGAQFLGQLLLGQPEVVSQSADAPAVPFESFSASH